MNLAQLYPGDKVSDPYSNIVFTVAGKSPYGDGVLLITDKVISAGAMDAPEPDSAEENYRITGNHDYRLSNLNQWLNSDRENWFSKTHPADTPPSEEYLSIRPTLYDPIGHNAYDFKPGFLLKFNEAFRSSICSSSIPCAALDGSSVDYYDTKVFCPSAAELGLITGVINEGSELPVFKDFRMRYSSPSEECLMESEWFPAYFRSHRIFWYWLRTPNTRTKGFMAYSHFGVPFAYKFVCCPWMGIRPLLSLKEDSPVKESRGAFGIHRFDW